MSNQTTSNNNQSSSNQQQQHQQQQQQGPQQMFTIPTGNGGSIQIPANAFSGGKFFHYPFGAWLTLIFSLFLKI